MPGADPITDGTTTELKMKFQGYIKEIWSPAVSAVIIVKANVTDLPVASGTRSDAAIVNDTPVTCPPSDPDGTPTLMESFVVLTVMPVGLPGVAGPNVTPLRVSTCDPAAKLPSTRINNDVAVGVCGNIPGTNPTTNGAVTELLMKFMG